MGCQMDQMRVSKRRGVPCWGGKAPHLTFVLSPDGGHIDIEALYAG